MIAYLLIHSAAGPLGLIVNLIVYLILALIIFFIIQWAAAEFGIPPKIVKLIGLLLFLLVILTVFIGCSTATGSADEAFYGHNQPPLYPTVTTKIEPLTKAELAEDAKREQQPLNRLGGFLVTHLLP